MSTNHRHGTGDECVSPRATWGPKLFIAALAGVLVFFWWLLIYSHGVAPHH